MSCSGLGSVGVGGSSADQALGLFDGDVSLGGATPTLKGEPFHAALLASAWQASTAARNSERRQRGTSA
jgi:hypothetical protein